VCFLPATNPVCHNEPMKTKLAAKTPNKLVAKAKTVRKSGVKGKAPTEQDLMQEMLHQISSVFEARGVSAEDMQALAASLSALSPDDMRNDEEADAKYEAQELAFEAMEAESAAQAEKLARRALQLDPECVDAMVLLTHLTVREQTKKIECLQGAVAAGERLLGAAFFRKNTGEFWLLLDTRPYMRALAQLAGAMATAGRELDAIAIYEKMLKLNPNDNQGVRQPLLGLYLTVDDLADAGRLLKRYKEDATAGLSWGRVLERFLAGDRDGASIALSAAMQANRYVAGHLTGKRRLPKALPEMYSLGSLEEAVLCRHYLGEAWAQHRDALLWLGNLVALST
jgi:tetratricopeptide (TPR) repeat protein